MGACINCCHVVFYVAALLATLGAVGLVAASLFTSKWLIAEHLTQGRERHEHGLYKDCVVDWDVAKEDYGPAICKLKDFSSIKETDESSNDQREQHKAKQWNVIMISLISTAGLLGIIAFLTALCASATFCMGPGFCVGTCGSSLWAIICFCAGAITAGALIYFVRSKYIFSIGWESLYTDNIQQTKGLSFYLALVGCILYGVAMIFAILCSIIGCVSRASGHRVATSKVAMVPKINYVTNTSV